MTEDQITKLVDDAFDMFATDGGIVKSKLRALVQMHVINAERSEIPTHDWGAFGADVFRRISEERRAHRDDILSVARERAEIAAEANRRREEAPRAQKIYPTPLAIELWSRRLNEIWAMQRANEGDQSC